MGVTIRLLLLLGAFVLVTGGGYWSIKHDLHQIAETVWQNIVFFVKTFDITVAIRAVTAWFQKMTAHWLFVEVPKRVLILLPLPYILLWLMPRSWGRAFRRVVVSMKRSILDGWGRFTRYLRADHAFGPYAGYALILCIGIVCFVFFYSVFWVVLAVWLGFVKMPAVIAAAFAYGWGKFTFFLQKTPITAILFRWSKAVARFLARLIPHWHWWGFFNEKERRKKALRRARFFIKKRYDKELFLRVGWREYRRLQKAAAKPPDAQKQPAD